MNVRSSLPALVAASLVLAVGGCGSGGGYGGGGGNATASGDSAGAGKTVSLSADANALKFDKSKVSVPSGTKTVTISMSNPSEIDHGIASGDQKGKVIGKGGTSTITLTGLKDGTYQLFCPVDGHAAAGMKATLVVGSGGGSSGGSGRYGY